MKPRAESATIKTHTGPEPNGNSEPGPENFPFALLPIHTVIAKETPGIYALGYLDEDKQFVVREIGRAEQDLRAELCVRLMFLIENALKEPGCKELARYSRFTFRYTKTAKEAFEEECREYHRLVDELDDKTHPSKDENVVNQERKGPRWVCPVGQCGRNY